MPNKFDVYLVRVITKLAIYLFSDAYLVVNPAVLDTISEISVRVELLEFKAQLSRQELDANGEIKADASPRQWYKRKIRAGST